MLDGGGAGGATPRPERHAPARLMQGPGRVAQTLGQRGPALVSSSFYCLRVEACLAARVSTGLVNAGAPPAPHGMRSARGACATAAWVSLFEVCSFCSGWRV